MSLDPTAVTEASSSSSMHSGPSFGKLSHHCVLFLCIVLPVGCLFRLPQGGCEPDPSQQLLTAMNEVRRARGLSPLVVNPRLIQAA